ncbi:MAG TPA: HD domain-containing phosphohydrolase [Thiobacillaceae bacterium]|nr:HD domain-containing phosphohydrolase [Thiobacillaceae bacterium]
MRHRPPETHAMDDHPLLAKLEQLNAIGVALSREEDIDHLLERILLSAIDLTGADAGTVYRVGADKALRFSILVNRSMGLQLGGRLGGAIDLPDIPLFDADGRPNDRMVAAHAAARQKTVNIADAARAEGFDFSGTREFNQRTGYVSRSFLTVPLIDHHQETIGVLQLINALDPASGAIRAFSAEEQRLAESLASQAAIAYTKRRLIDQLAELFESLVNLINAAIDEKSPYTSKHCERVPVLTMMIAEAADRMESGPLAGFRMTDQDRYELRIAGLMHDCGKITTPVHVMDKATKLEALFDRIHLLEARFEVLRRDAAIQRLEALLARPAEGDAIEAAYRGRLAELEADQAFLQRCNVGGEAMAAADQERVSRIAAYRWRDASGAEQPFLSPDEEACLRIPRGTLTDPEREVINHHIVSTIHMLEALPWPRHLERVPEYAGGHHERMDGKGYPRGLTGDQMSVQARIMAIADIFEALTAADRPYKAAKPLSECLAIMDRMAREGHIDPDLYAVFKAADVPLAYAREYLLPEQIDHH